MLGDIDRRAAIFAAERVPWQMRRMISRIGASDAGLA
jgi:hypothetical protein